MPVNTERRWQVQTLLGSGITPHSATFSALDGIMPFLNEDEDAEALEYVRQFFLPQEDGVGQIRQSEQRKADALRWSLENLGEVPAWLIRAGITPPAPLEPVVEPPAPVKESKARK
jgi:hypothetical protein